MIYPVQPLGQTQPLILPVDVFPGQKLEQSKDFPRRVMIRKRQTPSAREEVPREQVERVLDRLSGILGLAEKDLAFTLDEDDEGFTVKLVDLKSGEEVDERLAKQVLEMIKREERGIFIDRRI